MYTHQHATSFPLAAEEQRLRNAHYSKKTAENLVSVGLIDPPPPTDSRDKKKRTNAASSNKPRVRVLSPARQTQDPSHTPNLTHNRAGCSLANLSAGRRRHSGPDNTTGSLSARPLLKELHQEEMFATKGTARRERTFIGQNCAACEEPLEHTLRGERILQLSCGHVSHEACFYEYIKEFEAQTCPDCEKPLSVATNPPTTPSAQSLIHRRGLDPSRGGNLDFENLNKLVRNVQNSDQRDRSREMEQTPVPGDANSNRQSSHPSVPPRPSRDHLLPGEVQDHAARRADSYVGSHGRNGSNETGAVSSNGYSESNQTNGRRHDYDLQSMAGSINSPQIPAPIVTVRSEFPTLNRSRHQQSLTCLVTVEVMEGKWNPSPQDLRIVPPVPSPIPEELYESSPVRAPPPLAPQRQVDSVHEDMAMEEVKSDLFQHVENWHGLDVDRFGKLIIHGTVHVGKDRHTWQELECYLFSEMLICVKERKSSASQHWDSPEEPKARKCTLKGSILIKRHLKEVETHSHVLTLNLSVAELPAFHLRFAEQRQLDTWRRTLINITRPEPPTPYHSDFDHDAILPLEEEYAPKHARRVSSLYTSSLAAGRSQGTVPTEYSMPRNGAQSARLDTASLHIPLDIVVVIPVSSSTQGLKTNLLRDSLRFLLTNLGERDRMGLVTFGSNGGGMPLVGMTTKSWRGWAGALDLIRPVALKNMRADPVEGANAAMDLLMQRKTSNTLSHIVLISDSSNSDPESVDFVVSRAEAAKVAIHSFGLGLTHKPDTMVEMSTRTRASYTYVKDWMMLRECLAGCLGALQSTAHQNAKLRLRLPEGSPAKFIKISGALHVTKRATGRDAEISFGDLRFGDKRDILVQLAIQPDTSSQEPMPADPWENIISGLEALSPTEQEDQETASVEELPLLQADLTWGDILREGSKSQLPRPSLLAITMLPRPTRKSNSSLHSLSATPPIPPHPSVVQRRMELLTSDMLSRALNLVARNQNDRAQHLLSETRSILKGLGKGGLPPLPAPPPSSALPPTPVTPKLSADLIKSFPLDFPQHPVARTPSPSSIIFDKTTMNALDFELESSLEWICHSAVFGRDSRKAVLQAIGVISSQRGFTFRTPSEALWAQRIPGVRRLAERSREWRDETLREEM